MPAPTAIVTGASAGLGLTIARRFLLEGYRVTIMGRDSERLSTAITELHSVVGDETSVASFTGDAADVISAQELVREHLTRWSRLDVMVNVVGQSDRGRVDQLHPDRMRELFEANVMTTLVCSQAAMSALRESRGTIVNIGSLASRTAPRYLGGYVAAKHALAGLTRQMRLECEADGVHIGLICPGPIARPNSQERYREQVDAQTDVPATAAAPGGGAKLKGLSPERVADAVMRCVDDREIEIVLPGKARLLMILDAISPRLGDWLLKRKSS